MNSTGSRRELEEAYARDDHEARGTAQPRVSPGRQPGGRTRPKLAQLMSQITRYALESVYPTVEGWPEQSTHDHRRVPGRAAGP